MFLFMEPYLISFFQIFISSDNSLNIYFDIYFDHNIYFDHRKYFYSWNHNVSFFKIFFMYYNDRKYFSYLY